MEFIDFYLAKWQVAVKIPVPSLYVQIFFPRPFISFLPSLPPTVQKYSHNGGSCTHDDGRKKEEMEFRPKSSWGGQRDLLSDFVCAAIAHARRRTRDEDGSQSKDGTNNKDIWNGVIRIRSKLTQNSRIFYILFII